MIAVDRHIIPRDWITLTFVIIFAFIVVAKLIFPQRFDDFTKLLISNRYFDYRRGTKQLDYFSLFLFIVNILSVSILIFLVWEYFSAEEFASPKILFCQIALGYSMFFCIKYFLEKIIGDIFLMDKILNRYLWHKITFRNLLSLFLLVPTIFFIYGPTSRTGIILLIYAVVGFNLLMLGNFYRKNQKHILPQWFYFIVYLCALEIAPYFLLYKAIGF